MTPAAHPPAFARASMREAFARFPSGVAAIAAERDGKRHVLVASSFTVGVSLEPPLVLFCVQRTSSTWPVLRTAGRVGVSVLGEPHAQACRRLAGDGKGSRWEDVTATTLDTGAIRIEGSSLWLECSVFAVHPAGDHDVVLLEVHDLRLEPSVKPLIFHRSRLTTLA